MTEKITAYEQLNDEERQAMENYFREDEARFATLAEREVRGTPNLPDQIRDENLDNHPYTFVVLNPRDGLFYSDDDQTWVSDLKEATQYYSPEDGFDREYGLDDDDELKDSSSSVAVFQDYDEFDEIHLTDLTYKYDAKSEKLNKAKLSEKYQAGDATYGAVPVSHVSPETFENFPDKLDVTENYGKDLIDYHEDAFAKDFVIDDSLQHEATKSKGLQR